MIRMFFVIAYVKGVYVSIIDYEKAHPLFIYDSQMEIWLS